MSGNKLMPSIRAQAQTRMRRRIGNDAYGKFVCIPLPGVGPYACCSWCFGGLGSTCMFCNGDPFGLKDVIYWNGMAIPRLAIVIRSGKRWNDMGILIDMLLEAGLERQDTIEHLSMTGPHIRCCGVLRAMAAVAEG